MPGCGRSSDRPRPPRPSGTARQRDFRSSGADREPSRGAAPPAQERHVPVGASHTLVVMPLDPHGPTRTESSRPWWLGLRGAPPGYGARLSRPLRRSDVWVFRVGWPIFGVLVIVLAV